MKHDATQLNNLKKRYINIQHAVRLPTNSNPYTKNKAKCKYYKVLAKIRKYRK